MLSVQVPQLACGACTRPQQACGAPGIAPTRPSAPLALATHPASLPGCPRQPIPCRRAHTFKPQRDNPDQRLGAAGASAGQPTNPEQASGKSGAARRPDSEPGQKRARCPAPRRRPPRRLSRVRGGVGRPGIGAGASRGPAALPPQLSVGARVAARPPAVDRRPRLILSSAAAADEAPAAAAPPAAAASGEPGPAGKKKRNNNPGVRVQARGGADRLWRRRRAVASLFDAGRPASAAPTSSSPPLLFI